MDFADVLKHLGDIKKLLAFYEEFKDLLDPLLHKKVLPKPKPPVVVAPTLPVEPEEPVIGEDGEPVEKPTPPPVVTPNNVSVKQIYYKLALKLFFLEKSEEEVEAERRAGDDDPDKVVRRDVFLRVTSPQGPEAQMLRQRMHLDITPYEKDLVTEYKKGDPRHPLDDNGDPAMRYLWWIDGKLATHADPTGHEAEVDDPLTLESVRDDAGCTPVFRNEEEGPGRQRVELQAYIPATWNGGVEVYSNRVTWFKN